MEARAERTAVDESLRDRLAAELAEQPEPPLGDLVFDSLRQGKRLRLVRRAGIAGSALVAVAVLAVGVVLGGHLIGGTTHTPPASGAPSPLLTTASPTPTTTGIAQPAGPRSPTTLAAMAYRFRQLVPGGGVMSNYYHSDPNDPYFLRFYLSRDHGPGQVQIEIATNSSVSTCSPGDSTCHDQFGPDGARVQVISNSGNCVETTSVSVDHGNGVVVTIYVATCLPWNGSTNPPCPPALTAEEAIAIAADPSWGPRMSSLLVAAGNAQFPSLAIP